jgi:hypothetical protein
MSKDFKVSVDLSDFVPPGAVGVFPALAEAVAQVAESGVSIWRGYASGAPLPDGKIIHPRSGAYARSIRAEPGEGLYHAFVLSDAAYARALEEGTGPRDMKKMLDTSSKVRVSKSGKRYLIIPFRHGTPGSTGFANVMTPGVAAMAKSLATSRVTGERRVRSPIRASSVATRRPVMTTRRTYRWGGRLTADALRAAGARGSAARHQAGMVHMQNPGGQGGGKHGQYLTFRVMSEGSSGWITKGTDAYHPARETAEKLRPLAKRAFAAAVKRDIQAMLAGGGA